MSGKTWIEKRNCEASYKIKYVEKRFADIPEGSKMLIASPPIIDTYVKNIPLGVTITLATMRNDLASEYLADKTCPVTTGIFLRIVAEAAYEELCSGKKREDITPFWRVVDPNSKLATKLACGIAFIEKQRYLEH